MKSRLLAFFTHPITLAFLAVIVVASLFLLGTNLLKAIAVLLALVLVVAAAVYLVMWLIKRNQTRKESEEFSDALFGAGGSKGDNSDMAALRERMRDAVKSIKTSRLGQAKGSEALYELPWYMIIGNPAAGKSTAIVNSGLKFPFAEEHGSIVQGIGGTRNCDWYFTSEGIILDTAGRYSVQEENRDDWLGFLQLLRKYRPRAPINGIIIAASVAELINSSQEHVVDLAKKLRNRVQEVTEDLEVIAPVYVLFTKADLIAGFSEFFKNLDAQECNQVWGATLPFQADGKTPLDVFDAHFDELNEGLKEMSLAQLSMERGEAVSPGLLTLPLEFSGLKSSLHTFIATLFEDNPYQHPPVFRGFYFTSALQETAQVHAASDRISKQFHLAPASQMENAMPSMTSRSYFLLDLFRKVLFADKQLVQQYSSRGSKRNRYATFIGTALVLGIVLASWAWSYTDNRQLIASVQADLQKAADLQDGRVDLASRMQALEVLQDRLQQLQLYRSQHELLLGLGLYQGDVMEAKLRAEYFHGMRQIMLAPVEDSLQRYLRDVVAHGDKLQSVAQGKSSSNESVQTAGLPSPTDTQAAYDALRAYLMLADAKRVEPLQLSGQLAVFWRNWLMANRGLMSRDDLIASAQKLLSFYVTQYAQPEWPQIDTRLMLVADTRAALVQVMRGVSAIDRVYAQLKTRAANRYSPVTVASILGESADDALLAGSYAVPGAFTLEAWNGYIKDGIIHAANNELSVSDWVLQSDSATDLTLTGSPDQIALRLKAMYDEEYVTHWRAFMQGVSVKRFDNFAQAVSGMNVLGDTQASPIRTLLQKVYEETAWDSPTASHLVSEENQGLIAWFKTLVLARSSTASDISSAMEGFPEPTGKQEEVSSISAAFPGVGALLHVQGKNPPILGKYIAMLGSLRARLNAIKTRGAVGKGARDLMVATFEGKESELSIGLELVDEQMLDGLDAEQRKVLRPLLLRPLMRTFNALIAPAEEYINQVWVAQVYGPFKSDLSDKYPFNLYGNVKATDAEMAEIFGPAGAITAFSKETLGPLVNQFGRTLTAKQWAGMGLTLSPQLMAQYGTWTQPPGLSQGGAGDTHQVFRLLPSPTGKGISSYTINIDGQTLVYRNTPPQWASFVWGIPSKEHLVELQVTTVEGKTVTLEKFTGDSALPAWFKAADSKLNRDSGTYTLTWNNDGVSVSVQLQMIKSANLDSRGVPKQGLNGTQLPADIVGGSSANVANGSEGAAGGKA